MLKSSTQASHSALQAAAPVAAAPRKPVFVNNSAGADPERTEPLLRTPAGDGGQAVKTPLKMDTGEGFLGNTATSASCGGAASYVANAKMAGDSSDSIPILSCNPKPAT
jgi:hypothetical protein